MTSAPGRDPLADHLLAPQNAAPLFIGYQPAPLPGSARWTARCWSRTPFRRGEDWYWCYLDRLVFELQGVPPAPSHP